MMNRLIKFIKENLSKGYDANSIRDHLVSQGYNIHEVDQAFREVYKKAPHHKWVFLIGIIILIIIGSYFAVWYLYDETPAIPNAPVNRNAGNCNDRIRNNGESGIDCGGTCVKCSVAPQNQGQQNRTEAPDPVQVIIQQPQLVENSVKPSWEILNEIHQTSLTDPEKAGRQCGQVENTDTKDSCYLDLAQVTKNKGNCNIIRNEETRDDCYVSLAQLDKDSSLCSSIANDDQRDSCYMDFILDGDLSLCNYVVTQYYKNACEILSS